MLLLKRVRMMIANLPEATTDQREARAEDARPEHSSRNLTLAARPAFLASTAIQDLRQRAQSARLGRFSLLAIVHLAFCAQRTFRLHHPEASLS